MKNKKKDKNRGKTLKEKEIDEAAEKKNQGTGYKHNDDADDSDMRRRTTR